MKAVNEQGLKYNKEWGFEFTPQSCDDVFLTFKEDNYEQDSHLLEASRDASVGGYLCFTNDDLNREIFEGLQQKILNFRSGNCTLVACF